MWSTVSRTAQPRWVGLLMCYYLFKHNFLLTIGFHSWKNLHNKITYAWLYKATPPALSGGSSRDQPRSGFRFRSVADLHSRQLAFVFFLLCTSLSLVKFLPLPGHCSSIYFLVFSSRPLLYFHWAFCCNPSLLDLTISLFTKCCFVGHYLAVCFLSSSSKPFVV